MATAFKQVVHANLECPVCLSFFKDPKILTCSHTFCKGCLETLLETYQVEEKISCPVCRKDTSIPGGDVSTLQPNISVRSLVEDLETKGHVCANCDPTLAVVYCNECGDYLCESCKDIYSKWVRYSSHSLVEAGNVLSSEASKRRRCRCVKHPNENEECFCFDCIDYVCFRCCVLDHAQEGHRIMEAGLHESKQQKQVEELTSRVEAKISNVDKYITCIAEKRESLQEVRTQLIGDINEAFERAVKKLTERNEVLKSDVGQWIKKLDTSLVDMEDTARQRQDEINTVCGLVKNGLKVPLQKEALTAHNTLCQELEQLLDRIDHDETQPRRTAEEGEHLQFARSKRSDGLELGQIRRGESKWILHAQHQLPVKNSMNTIAVSPENVLIVGCTTGGIVAYTSEGLLQENVLDTGVIRACQITSDGKYVIRGADNLISLFTSHGEKLDVTYETASEAEGGRGGLSVDKDGHILASYVKTEMTQVFKPKGGKATREISCEGLKPWQIFALTFSNLIVIKSQYEVYMTDGVSGATIHSITKNGELPYPAVCKDDSVIIAWVKSDQYLVSIDQYTKELKHIKNLLTNFKITKPSRNWSYLQQFKTGEIAFCTPDKLYIFRETWM